MIDDLVRAYPGTASAVIVLLIGALHALLQVIVRRLDRDVKKNSADIAAQKEEMADLRSEVRVWRSTTEGHIKDEERTVWPQIRRLVENAEAQTRLDAEAHATILERMNSIAREHAAKIGALEALVRNGRRIRDEKA